MGQLPILNPETVSQCDGSYEVGGCHAADIYQKAADPSIFFELLV
jgi:hypothetical protein